MCQFSPVTFYGDTIFCLDYQNQPYTPAKPIVENIGLDWQSQAAKLRANKTRWGVVIIATPSEGGEQLATCLPARKLPAWLASINPKKVRSELRERIELYQRESDDALWAYWVEGRAVRERLAHPSPSITTTTSSTGAERRELHALVTREWCPRSGMHNYECWQKLNAHLGLKSIMDLPRERIGEAMSWVRAQIEGYVSPAPSGHAHLPVSKTDLCTLPVQASHLPKLHTLFKDIQRAADCLAPSENWTHLAVRFELGDAAAPAAKHAVDMHVNAAWYALGLARSSLLAAVAVGKPALA